MVAVKFRRSLGWWWAAENASRKDVCVKKRGLCNETDADSV